MLVVLMLVRGKGAEGGGCYLIRLSLRELSR